MERRRIAAVAFLLAGIALIVAMHAFEPPGLEWVFTEGKPTPGGLAIARGPAYAKLDNGSTLLSFGCSHQNCATAVRVEGDARGAASERAVLVRGGPWTTASLDPPWALATGPGFVQNVTSVVAAPVTIVPRWPFVAASGVAVALASTGLALFSRRLEARHALEAGAASLVGLALANLLAAQYAVDGGLVLILLVATASLFLAGAAFAVARSTGWGRLAGWGFLTFGIGFVAGGILIGPYFPACCQM